MGHNPRSLGAALGAVNAEAEGVSTELLALTGEVLRASDLERALGRITECGVESMGFRHLVVLGPDDTSPASRLVAAGGVDDASARRDVLSYARGLASWAARTRLPVGVTGTERDPRFGPPPDGAAAALACPLLEGEMVQGVLVATLSPEEDGTPPPLRAEELGFLACLATQALVRDTLRRERRDLSRRLQESETARLQSERLAAVGELVAEMAHEIQTPLASLSGFASRLAETLPPEDERRSMLEVMQREVERLDRLLGDQVEMARSPDPELFPDDINRVLEECLLLESDTIKARRVRVTRRLADTLPTLLLDLDLMRRIFLNMLRGAMERMAPGGRLKVESKRKGNEVEVVVAADVPRGRGETLEQMWRPFLAEGKRPGDVAAVVLERMLTRHQGVLQVTSDSQWPLLFRLRLPIADNKDRRRPGSDRRRRDRRRA